MGHTPPETYRCAAAGSAIFKASSPFFLRLSSGLSANNIGHSPDYMAFAPAFVALWAKKQESSGDRRFAAGSWRAGQRGNHSLDMPVFDSFRPVHRQYGAISGFRLPFPGFGIVPGRHVSGQFNQRSSFKGGSARHSRPSGRGHGRPHGSGYRGDRRFFVDRCFAGRHLSAG